jgi:hypothetical protein
MSMMTKSSICLYCGRESIKLKGPKCFFCGMVLENKYVIYIDSKFHVINLCSTNCLDLLEASTETNDRENVEEEDGYDLTKNACPICTLKSPIGPIEAKSVCILCGMLVPQKSPEYIIREKSSYYNFCCPRCLKLFGAAHGLDLCKTHSVDDSLNSDRYSEVC